MFQLITIMVREPTRGGVFDPTLRISKRGHVIISYCRTIRGADGRLRYSCHRALAHGIPYRARRYLFLFIDGGHSCRRRLMIIAFGRQGSNWRNIGNT